MANGFSPNIYSGGAVVFDTSPTVDLVNQIVNRRRAQDEALEQHAQNQFKNVNPAGMRTQDIPFFTQKINEAQKFWQEKRQAILNPRLDGGVAQSEYQSRLMDAQATIAQSKGEQKKYEDFVPILRDPDKRSRIPQTVIDDLAAHELPINDPTRRSFDISRLNFDAKPFDVGMQQKFLQGVQQGVKMDKQISDVKKDPNTFSQTVTTTSSLGPEAKETILARSSGAYQSDPSFKRFIDEQVQSPEIISQYNDAFKKAVGRDIQTPEDLAGAWSLSAIQDNLTEQKNEADWEARQDYLQGQRVALLNKRLAAEKTGKPPAEGWINEYIGVLKEQSLAGPKIQYKHKNGQVVEEYDIPMDATLAKMLQKGDIQPDYLRYNPQTGKFRPIYAEHYTDEKGKRTTEIVKDKSGQFRVDEQLSQPISEPQLVLSLGGRVTPTQRTVEMKKSLELQKGGSNKPFKIEGKPYTRKQLNDMGYDDDEIEQFIKSGVIAQ